MTIYTRTCSKCQQDLNLSCFTIDRSRPSGLSYHCRTCQSQLNGYKTQRDPLKPFDRKQHSKAYRQAHRPRYAALAAKRKAQQLRATPPWAELVEIQKLYEEAARITHKTGVLHTVDHIVPLQGKNVSGLHCLANLRIITGSENSRKSNRFTS